LGTPSTPNKGSFNNSEELEKLSTELNRLKHLFDDKFNQLIKLIEKRAIKEDVENLERRFQDQINDIIKNFIDRFADKKEMAKKLAAIEKQVSLLN
jgi:molecular chaperone GrpE (heat shock protein)